MALRYLPYVCDSDFTYNTFTNILIHSRCPYVVGNKSTLQLGAPYNDEIVEARITQVFEPFTLARVMIVQLNSPALGLSGNMVLKVFDQRFASQTRENEKADPWTLDIGKQYHQFILDGGESDNSGEDGDDDDEEEEDKEEEGEEEQKEWTAPRNEADLHNPMQRLYHTEVDVYQTLKDHQGQDIPHFLAGIAIPDSSPMQRATLAKHIDIPGILLQNIDGFHLADLAQHAPRETWQYVCEDTIQITSLLYNRGI